MGIDAHVLNFLRYSKRNGAFGETVTVGRQTLSAPEEMIQELLGNTSCSEREVYCERLLMDCFGASSVESIDNSDYEQARVIHDMNRPLPERLSGRFDTVFDGGCLEHIFNVPQALRNCSLLLKPGGQIIHILPANNFCGHGFWQMSPELFFSLYSERNGYSDTEVFLADLTDNSKWYQVTRPVDGKRVDVVSDTQVYVMVRTVLKGSVFSHEDVQQSDYRHEWESVESSRSAATSPKTGGLRRAIVRSRLVYSILRPFHEALVRSRSTTRLNARNPGLRVVDVRSVIRGD